MGVEKKSTYSHAFRWDIAKGYSIREIPYSFSDTWGFYLTDMLSNPNLRSHDDMQLRLADLSALNRTGMNPLDHHFGPAIQFLRSESSDHSLNQKYRVTHNDTLGTVRISYTEGDDPTQTQLSGNGKKRIVTYAYDMETLHQPLSLFTLEEVVSAGEKKDQGLRKLTVEVDHIGAEKKVTDERHLFWTDLLGTSHVVEMTIEKIGTHEPTINRLRMDGDSISEPIYLYDTIIKKNELTYPANWILQHIPRDTSLFII